jgi:short-subunit dehydrogenase
MATTALVTGGGSGIGRGIALALARRGMQVIVAGRRANLLCEAAGEITAIGSKSFAITADLSVPEERLDLLDEARRLAGPLDLLVNNAGVFSGGDLAALARDEVMRSIEVNLAAAIDLTYLALPDLTARRGSVVLLGSSASFVRLPYASLYSAAKSGLRAFGESLRYELAGSGVNVLMAYPPDTATAMTAPMGGASGIANFSLASPEVVGERIAKAIAQRKREVRWGVRERTLHSLYHVAPWLVEIIFRAQRTRFARMMAAGREGKTST